MSPDAFFQVNTEGAEVLFEVVRTASLFSDGVHPDLVLDVCCGGGAIGERPAPSSSLECDDLILISYGLVVAPTLVWLGCSSYPRMAWFQLLPSYGLVVAPTLVWLGCRLSKLTLQILIRSHRLSALLSPTRLQLNTSPVRAVGRGLCSSGWRANTSRRHRDDTCLRERRARER